MFGRLGHKKNHSPLRVGHKSTGGGLRAGLKSSIVEKVISDPERAGAIAGRVESISGGISKVAGTGATLAAMTGLGVPVASALGSVSATAQGVSQGAGMVRRGAEKATQAKSVYDKVLRFMP